MASENESHFLLLQEVLNGGIVNKSDVAVNIAELIIASIYGEDEVERQRPFTASDESDRWFVEGSYNKNGEIEGPGPIKIWIRKRDAKILDLKSPVIMKNFPEALESIRKSLKDEN